MDCLKKTNLWIKARLFGHLSRGLKTKRKRIRIKYPSVSTVARIIRYLKDIGGGKRLNVSFYARSGRVVVRRKRYKNLFSRSARDFMKKFNTILFERMGKK